jgi:o-succinylbenzoate synthase
MCPFTRSQQGNPEQVELLLNEICTNPESYLYSSERTEKIPSVHFALESAWFDLQNKGKQQLFPSDFSIGKAGIPINGLVWMGSAEFMQQQIAEKLNAGFRCIKLKIGGIDFETELAILKSVRSTYPPAQVTLRLDANGAFGAGEALDKLQKLAPLQIHSIEQPITAGHWKEMALICKTSPIPVALDEELIGLSSAEEKEELLNTINPQYLILKPSLHGGFSGCSKWIELAENHSIGWWVTSSLESNIGLNAIAQWTYSKKAKGYQGLGTGALFTNNIPSPLEIRGEELWLNPDNDYDFPDNIFKI